MLLACPCSSAAPRAHPALDVEPSLRRPLRTFLTALGIGVALVAVVLIIVYTRGR